MERFDLQRKGAKWYVTDDEYSPNLSKASLGEFCYTILSNGGQLGEFYCLNHLYQRSHIQCSVYLTDDIKTKIETETKFRFKDPPIIKVNQK